MIPAGSGQDKASAGARPALGLYVHVPFCATTCDFCAFYQVKPDAAAIALYLEGIERERAIAGPDRGLTTLFWGGGTPGLLPTGALERLAGLMPNSGAAEWSVELAPASVTGERLAALKAAGVSRVSMGVQSFSPEWLDALGRMHSREQVYRAYDLIRRAGFDNVNLDLMFALPGQTAKEWEADVKEVVRLAPEHVSTYCLTFEEDTALWVKLSQGRVKLDVDREAELYERTWEWLGAAGYGQYEISNFARPGRECLHNVNTWRMQEWIGWGPSAASQHQGWRGRNVADLKRWRDDLLRSERAGEDRTELTPELLLEDALIFGLRMNEGVNLEAAARAGAEAASRRFPSGASGVPPLPRRQSLERKLHELAEEGMLTWDGPIARLTRKGRLLADRVGAELML